MRIQKLHSWKVSPSQAIQIQKQLRSRIISKNAFSSIREIKKIAGVDISVKENWARAVVVILSFPDMESLEERIVTQRVEFPYVPGLLSFRESPSIIAAFEQITQEPDVVMFDGQGLAHPRRFGIASHLGLLLEKPAIGCAKSRLCGRHEEPAEKAGSFEYLYDGEDVIGAAVRSKDKTKVLYVSVGHKIDLKTAVEITLACHRGYRLPEPTRLADRVAGGASLFPKQMDQGKQISLGS